MVGAEVTELIQGFVVAMTLGATDEALTQVMFPHPTLSEVMHESALSANGLALHM
jgi:dihydrolipoyl dehydrogenase